jgi:endonuclease IV
VGAGEEVGLANIARAIDAVHNACAGFRTRITLEITAGQGTNLGYRFAHMRALLDRVQDSDRLRFCFDTQHAFAAGYDLSTAAGYERTFAEFDGKFHNQQKVDNSFLRQTLAFRHRPLCRSLDSRLWFNRLSPRVRSFLTAM